MAKSKTKPVAPPAPPDHSLGTSTSVGWSFWSTALDCWWMWWQRYGEGWELLNAPDYFDFGSAYHAMHEYDGDIDLAAGNVKQSVQKLLAKARDLHAVRQRGPPLPVAVEKERLHAVTSGPLAGLYTAKPDQIEMDGNVRTARDFKTSGRIKPSDPQRWAVDGEIIGEMVASDCKVAIVDIVTKEAVPKVSQIEVSLTEAKRLAHQNLILDLYRQIKERLALKDQRSAEVAFPRNLRNCCPGRPCLYYPRCWETGATSQLYRINKARRDAWRNWLKLDGGK